MQNAMYPELAAPSEHPANIGLNFHFDENGISIPYNQLDVHMR